MCDNINEAAPLWRNGSACRVLWPRGKADAGQVSTGLMTVPIMTRRPACMQPWAMGSPGSHGMARYGTVRPLNNTVANYFRPRVAMTLPTSPLYLILSPAPLFEKAPIKSIHP